MAIVRQIPFPVAIARVICRARFARYRVPTAETSMPAIVPAGHPTVVPNAVKAAASASGPMPAATVTAVAMPTVRSEWEIYHPSHFAIAPDGEAGTLANEVLSA